MGVCSMHTHPHHEHVLAVGSYDETISIWDTRSFKSLLLAACMHNGFQVHDVARPGKSTTEEQQRRVQTRAHYTQQTSLAYGVDWWLDPATLQSQRQVVGSASFYDHAFHVWSTVTTSL
ncbi:hypothetical protein DYB37_007966 [Aphanomyces astaci]|uniref:methylated diphthine methylhydrolase n=1 Tax=Aphanomyces astaci TaxID=112090 RepID=A0A3R6WL11_APHAT|nr:hypothetical protein DYB35_010793 [Aphanomyces astaci]RHZ28881.1 hypothetical protein DYB37_007966 [Aphanomyces astaci]